GPARRRPPRHALPPWRRRQPSATFWSAAAASQIEPHPGPRVVSPVEYFLAGGAAPEQPRRQRHRQYQDAHTPADRKPTVVADRLTQHQCPNRLDDLGNRLILRNDLQD